MAFTICAEAHSPCTATGASCTPSRVLEPVDIHIIIQVTGSYPQIIHAKSKDVTGGTITCTEFVDDNEKTYTDWIPAIRLE